MAIEGPADRVGSPTNAAHTYSDEEGDRTARTVNFAGGVIGALRGSGTPTFGWVSPAAWRTRRATPGPARDPVVRFVDRTFICPGCWPGSPSRSGSAGRSRAARSTAALPGSSGRRRADLVLPPRHLLDQLALPLLRQPRLRDVRPLDQLAWLAPLSFGESWHNNHHAFPRSAVHGLGRGQLDLSALVIRGSRRSAWLGIFVIVTPERQDGRRCPARERRVRLVGLPAHAGSQAEAIPQPHREATLAAQDRRPDPERLPRGATARGRPHRVCASAAPTPGARCSRRADHEHDHEHDH